MSNEKQNLADLAAVAQAGGAAARADLDNVNIISRDLLPTPNEVRQQLPLSPLAANSVRTARQAVQAILSREDHRMIGIVGPCSIHDLEAATEYAERLKGLADEVSDTLLLVMRVYFEKPRTSVGWKGFINDPHLDDTFCLGEGLHLARQFMIGLAERGLALATEALDPITPQYLSELWSWVAIGARTAESQTHREMASGLSAPVGFKNATDGNIAVAVNALKAVNHPQHFLGLTGDGQPAVYHTRGNRYGHLILRGGSRPNYDSVSVAMSERALAEAGLPSSIVVDCSHGNSLKDPEMQPLVLQACTSQLRDGNSSIIGFMLESNLEAGKQSMAGGKDSLRRGVSITDGCIDWKTTESTLRRLREQLKDVLVERHERVVAERRTKPEGAP